MLIFKRLRELSENIDDSKPALEYTCNKYCDLIGQEEFSISHRGPTNF